VSLRRRIAIVVAIVVVAFGVYFRVSVWPWIAAPDPAQVDGAWKSVETAVKDSKPAPGGGEKLDAFLAAVRAAKPELEELAKQANARTDETLPEKTHAALDALSAWADGAGVDEGAPVCPKGALLDPAFDIITMWRLATVALTTPPVAPRTLALTKLSERLRRRGPLLHYVVGMKILERLLEHAAVNPQGLPRFLKDTNADASEMRSALARDETCADALFEGEAGMGIGRDDLAPVLARPFISTQRERAMFRLFVGERIRSTEGVTSAAEVATKLGEMPAQLPKSVAVRRLALNGGFSSVVPVIKRYDELKKR
jgi:hypothetical protein